MSKQLRKNASLASVATAARQRAERARAEWQRYTQAARELGADQFWRQCQARMAFERYSDLDEIASHLERLSA